MPIVNVPIYSEQLLGELKFLGKFGDVRKDQRNRTRITHYQYSLRSSKLPTEKVIVEVPVIAGLKDFDFGQSVKLEDEYLTAEGIKYGRNNAVSAYLLHSADLIKK